jgi:hypothetical protein
MIRLEMAIYISSHFLIQWKILTKVLFFWKMEVSLNNFKYKRNYEGNITESRLMINSF